MSLIWILGGMGGSILTLDGIGNGIVKLGFLFVWLYCKTGLKECQYCNSRCNKWRYCKPG